MNQRPILYIGIAAPLVEAARVWLVELPKIADAQQRQAKMQAFPKNEIGAYGFSLLDGSVLTFRAGINVDPERVRTQAEQWAGKPPELLPLLQPRPTVLFLSACHSETVLKRAKDVADWRVRASVALARRSLVQRSCRQIHSLGRTVREELARGHGEGTELFRSGPFRGGSQVRSGHLPNAEPDAGVC